MCSKNEEQKMEEGPKRLKLKKCTLFQSNHFQKATKKEWQPNAHRDDSIESLHSDDSEEVPLNREISQSKLTNDQAKAAEDETLGSDESR